jgi:hypothetical protein
LDGIALFNHHAVAHHHRDMTVPHRKVAGAHPPRQRRSGESTQVVRVRVARARLNVSESVTLAVTWALAITLSPGD